MEQEHKRSNESNPARDALFSLGLGAILIAAGLLFSIFIMGMKIFP